MLYPKLAIFSSRRRADRMPYPQSLPLKMMTSVPIADESAVEPTTNTIQSRDLKHGGEMADRGRNPWTVPRIWKCVL